jgi:hypothetical protein
MIDGIMGTGAIAPMLKPMGSGWIALIRIWAAATAALAIS